MEKTAGRLSSVYRSVDQPQTIIGWCYDPIKVTYSISYTCFCSDSFISRPDSFKKVFCSGPTLLSPHEPLEPFALYEACRSLELLTSFEALTRSSHLLRASPGPELLALCSASLSYSRVPTFRVRLPFHVSLFCLGYSLFEPFAQS